MNRKCVVVILVILFLGLSTNASALNDQQEIKTKTDIEEPLIEPNLDGFLWCKIEGKYQTKSSDENFQLILTNEDPEDETIKATGWGFEIIKDWYLWGFFSINCNSLKAERFVGYCRNGKVFGFGWRYVEV